MYHPLSSETPPFRYIALAGNIGSGKTTLAQKLATHYGYALFDSEDSTNPYLYLFYQDMARWSFQLQVYFLQKRTEQFIRISRQGQHVIQDRTLYEDVYVFSVCLQEMGLFSERDYETYKDLFETIKQLTRPPSLVIYLQSSVDHLVRRIEKRGRAYEQNIRIDYLTQLNRRYEMWAKDYRDGQILTINVDQVDVDDSSDFKNIITRVNACF